MNAGAVTETDSVATFATGSTGYAVPATSVNLLAAAGTTLVASPVNPAIDGVGGRATDASWSSLTNGAFGLVPATGGGGPGEVRVNTGNTLTYTFATPQDITVIDTFTGWGDGGRMQQDYTVQYATAAAPSIFNTIKVVAYHPGGNSAWVRLTNLGVSQVKSVKFIFGNQQNGYVGFTELAVQSGATAIEEDHIDTFPAGGAGYQPLITCTAPANLLAAPGTTLALTGGAPATPLSGTGASSSWAKLSDGSFGLVPAPGAGSADAVQVANNYTLTYTFASAQTIGFLDVYTGWGDGGRMQQDYTINYATAAAPSSYLPLKTVAYHPSGNSAWVHLIATGLTNISSIQFAFGAQQNGYVGVTELSVLPPTPPPPPPGAFTRSDNAANFNAGTTGYQSNVPSAATNVLSAAAGTVLTLGVGTPVNPPVPEPLRPTSSNWATLTDGSFGIVPAGGGGSPDSVTIYSGYALTYTFAAPTPLAGLDVFTCWGDSGRMWQDLTISYTTTTSGCTFITIPAIAYHPGGNSTWVHFSLLTGYSNVTAVRFTFDNQQNGYVGFTELSAVAPRPDVDADNLPDDWEIAKAGNLTDLTGLLSGPGPGAGSGNYDGDTLTDLQEFNNSLTYPNLDPKLYDTDGDGLEDGSEIAGSPPRPPTDPTNADTDGDGLSDGIESNSGSYAGPGSPGTSPISGDTDGDQYPDGYEIQSGSNPVDVGSLPTSTPTGIALGIVTDEVSTGISADKTFTHKISGGGSATVNGVILDALTDSVTPADFTWTAPGGKNIVSPINNGTWSPAGGNVTGPGNLNLFGGFSYSGGGGGVGGTQSFTLSNLQIGLSYELRLYIRKWDNGTVRPQALKFTNGAAVTNYYILEDRPGTVLSNNNDDSAYYISYAYVAQGTSIVVQATVPNVSSASGSLHMYGLINCLTTPPAPLDFASTVRAADGSSVTLNIVTRAGHTYAVDYSTDLGTWIELTDSVPATGALTVYVDTVASNLLRAQYRVRDVTP